MMKCKLLYARGYVQDCEASISKLVVGRLSDEATVG
jgi:hypothetical protein